MNEQHRPTGIQLHKRSRELELSYANGERYRLSCEYLRVYSPSAEVLGHGPGQEVLQSGKLHVAITDIKPVGNYALQMVFDDGHDTGLYSWGYLYTLCTEYEQRWQQYLERLNAAGAGRDPNEQILKLD
ncbi:MAG: DUF971 domain-containing protein [Halioglobus sp.]